MNKTSKEVVDFFTNFKYLGTNEVAVCPSLVYLEKAKHAAKGTGVEVFAQVGDYVDFGARTGAVSMMQLKDLEIKKTLVGHSERRTIFGENDNDVASQLSSAIRVGIDPILCFGESLAEYEAKITTQVLKSQIDSALKIVDKKDLAKIIFAYEPI
jgi:triosephosphate isomerase